MTFLRRWTRRLTQLLRSDAVEHSMDAELRHHLDRETAERVRQGMPADAARLSALRDFGGLEQVKEAGRDARGTRPVEDLVRDLRYAGRILRRNPGFTAASVLTFTLGMGAATAIFSVVYGVLLRPLPYARPDRLLALWERHIPRNVDQNVVSADNFEAWRTRSRSFDAMAGLMPTSVTVQAGDVPERVAGAEVSPGYFRLLGVPLEAGRDFSEADARDDHAVILSDGYWRRRYGGDPSILGRPLTMGDRSYVVVGIAAPGFDPPAFGWLGEQQLWFPLAITDQNRAWGRFLLVIGRLKDGVTIEAARAELAAIAEARAVDTRSVGWSASVMPLAQQITGDVRTSLLVLLAGVGLLLLMAVTNVATLTGASMQRRGQELAVRRALGATDRRLFRQLFAQSALLAAIGAAAGLAIAGPGVRLLVLLLPPDVPRAGAIHIDAPVLLATTAGAIVATLIFGSLAAFRGRKAASLAPGGAGAGDVRSTARSGGGVLIAAEIALGLALSVMAVLMARSFVHLRSVDLGFEPTGVAIARIAIPGDRYATPDGQRAFFDRLLDSASSLPGVRAAGLMSVRPFGGTAVATTVSDPLLPASPTAVADIRFVDPAAFQALRIHFRSGAAAGRDSELAGSPKVVVSAALAQALWPGREAVGRTIALELNHGIVAEVSGVAADVHLLDPRTAPRPAAYLSDRRYPSTQRDLILRVDGDAAAVIAPLRAAVAALEPGLPLSQVATLPQLVDRSVAADRFTALLLAAFALVSLLLASVGVFSVFSGDVSRRRKEIGIRLALGATGGEVAWLLLVYALRRAVIGVGAGAALAFVLARGMRSILFGVDAADPASFLAVSAAVVAVVIAATLIPVRQALRTSPVRALRDS